MAEEWRAGPLHQIAIAGPRPSGLVVQPCDLRPASAANGERLLVGVFSFGAETLDVGAGGDPWTRASPSRRFAARLHGFEWLRDLMAAGEAGRCEALRLWSGWRRGFGRYNHFAWSGEALERRVFNLTCAAPALLSLASASEGAALLDSLARQARHLAGDAADPARAAERAAVAALAGAALAGRAGERLLLGSLARLAHAAPNAVLRDGVHASRSPERGLELLFDLLALDDALSQRGQPAPLDVARSIDRLTAAVRFFAAASGGLPAFHGGEPGERERIAGALALDESAAGPGKSAPYGRFQRLMAPGLQIVIDTGVPPDGVWRGGACVQPTTIEVLGDGARLIVGSSWSNAAGLDAALRGPVGGSCLAIGDVWPQVGEVTAERQEDAEAIWVDVGHDGWRRAFGLVATRRLYLSLVTGDLRGEDQLSSIRRRRGESPFAVRFLLDPGVAAELADDRRSVLLRPVGARSWRLRSDANEMRLEPALVCHGGESRVTQALVLTGDVAFGEGVRLRWRLSRAAG
jgi:uncharacterized heparinase superfamily protein